MDPVGQLIERGWAATEELWRAPDDLEIRNEARGVFDELRTLVDASGTPEMRKLCELFCPNANSAPTPQAIEIMQGGLARLRQLRRDSGPA